MPQVDYTHIFEDSLNEIYAFDAETLHFIEVNRGARQNLGYSLAELRALTPLDLKLDYTPQTFAALIAPLRAGTREKIIFETTHHRKDSTFYPVEVHLHLSTVGKRPVFVAIILDITARKQAEEHALQLALEQQRMRLLREFIGDASHDLRTPITQIGTSLYLLRHHAQNPRLDSYIQRSQDALSRVTHMIDSMLQLVALDIHENYRRQPLNLNTLLADIVDANAVVAQQHDVALTFVPATPPPIAIVDHDYLTRAVENILTNGVKYTPPGGTVTIHAQHVPGYAEICVQDTGVGIAPEHLPHIFERFYRADDARDTTNGSNGLGLSIAQKIVEKHGGTITVQSTVGAGTTFCLRLPLAAEEAAAENAAGVGRRVR